MAVRVHVNAKPVETQAGQTLFACAEQAGVRVPTSCFEQGKCRECLVEVTEGMERLSPRSPEEVSFGGRFRLACRARVCGETGEIHCRTLRRGAFRIEEKAIGLSGIGRAPRLDPAVRREGDRIVREGAEGAEGALLARSSGPLHGLALDLGTSTVVLRLLNLENGETLASRAFENPQRFGGSDVMARIRYDGEHRGRLLQRTLIGYLNHAIEALPGDPQDIYEMVAVGNPTMRDLLFGLPVESIGQKPYRSITEHEFRDGKRSGTSLSLEAKRLRLAIHPKARVYGLPLVGCHVGADAAACLLAIDLPHEDQTVALMDIGTNTELLVGNRKKVLAASCPAGPAFEGGGIACGMPGLDGAIERVALNGDGSVKCSVIGGGVPEGICGSGLMDLLGELLRTRRINAQGRLADGAERFVVDPERNIFLSESDISQLAQAKGANVAGIQIVLERYGIGFQDLDRFYLAGGFARHLSLNAARRMGLIPPLPNEKIVQIGNAAIEGASVALRSRSRRRELEAFVRTITHVELETHPEFFNYFVEGCQFVPLAGAPPEAVA